VIKETCQKDGRGTEAIFSNVNGEIYREMEEEKKVDEHRRKKTI
jgi:hypothetical protein